MKKFEVGKTYYTRSACDHNCIYRFTVVSRTAKMVTVIDGLGEKLKRKVSEWQYGSQEAEELIHPYGHYSMAPCVGATDDYIKGYGRNTPPRKGDKMKQEVEKLRAEGYPLKIIGNGGYPATLYGVQPLNDGEYMAIYRYQGGQCCHDLNEIKQYFKVVEW